MEVTAWLEAFEKTAPDEKPAAWAGLIAGLVLAVGAGAGIYLYLGDYSALGDKAVAQIEAARNANVAQKSFDDSIAVLERAVAGDKDRDNLEAWSILAENYYNTEDYAKAENACRNVIRLDAKNAVAYDNLADILVAKERRVIDEIARLAFKAVELDPWQQKTLLLAGMASEERGDFKNAVIYWNRLKTMMGEGKELSDILKTYIDKAMKEGHMRELPADPGGRQSHGRHEDARHGRYDRYGCNAFRGYGVFGTGTAAVDARRGKRCASGAVGKKRSAVRKHRQTEKRGEGLFGDAV